MDFATLKTTTKNWLNRNDLTSDVGNFINIALRKIENDPYHNFKYMRSYATAAFADGDYTLAYPTRYKAVHVMFVQDTDNRFREVKKNTLSRGLREYPYLTTDKGFPALICDDDANSQFILRPTIDQAYTYQFYYYAYSAELSGDADTNWWTDNYWEVLMYRALHEASMFLKDTEAADLWMSKYREAFKDMADTQIDNEWAGSTPERTSDYVV